VADITVARLLILAAFLAVLGSALGRAPLWVAVLLLVVVALLQNWPAR